MTSYRVTLWTLSVILLITIASVESIRRPRPRRQPPPPLYLYPGPHPPSSRKRGPPRRPIQSSSYHSDLIYNDPESSLYRGSHSKPPSLYKPYDEYMSSPYSRPSKPKKPSYSRGPPPSKKYPYYTSATSHKSSRPMSGSPYSSSPYHSDYHSDHHADYHSDYSSEQIPKETIATFINRPSSSYKGTPILKYNGHSNKPTISYGPPYPPKPFKSYGVPSASSQEYVEEEYDDEEMFGSHPHSTAIKNPKNSSAFASSHYSFDNGNTAVQYANDGHGSHKYGPNKFTADRDVLVDPNPMRPIPSTPVPFQLRNRNKRPQRGDDSQHFSPSTTRPFKANNVVRHPTPETPKYPAVDINGPKYKSPAFDNNQHKYSSIDMTASYISKSPGNSRYPEITGPTPVYPDQVEVITGGRPQFSVKEVFPNHDTTKHSSSNVNMGDDQIRNNYDQFLKETFTSPKHRTQGSNDQYSQQEQEPTSSPPNHKPSRTRSSDSSKHRERQRTTTNRTKSRLRTQPTRQYEVHDDPEDREDTVTKFKDFEYTE